MTVLHLPTSSGRRALVRGGASGTVRLSGPIRLLRYETTLLNRPTCRHTQDFIEIYVRRRSWLAHENSSGAKRVRLASRERVDRFWEKTLDFDVDWELVGNGDLRDEPEELPVA